MHQGRPYGLHVVGSRLTNNDEAFIAITARRFSNLKDLSSLDSLRMVYDLPDGGYFVVQDMGGNFRIIAHKTDITKNTTSNGVATDYIPMLYSGLITKPTPFANAGVSIKLTETTRRRLVGYDPNQSLPSKDQELQRFRVEYADRFKYFEPSNIGNTFFSQYTKQRATWYSGLMSEVVQFVGGYGRQDISSLPDNSIERQTTKLPKQVLDEVRANLVNKRLPGYSGIPNREGQYQYSYTFYDCNGVAFDESNKPWLLQISVSGLYAMPLPVIPSTTTAAFSDYIDSVSDDEIRYILDRFGGMPSGETFPIGKDFQAWLRAGVIIKLCDMSEFYKNQPFYLACGWAFNDRGDEAFNTCWSYAKDSMKHAHAYKIKITLQSSNNAGWLDDAVPLSSDEYGLLSEYIGGIFAQTTGDGHREKAIRYKIMRQPVEKLIAYANSGTADINFWENMTDNPIANHSANLVRVSTGPAYWPGKYVESFGAIKFPEFAGQGCESFDMTALDYSGPSIKCDTIVFGCYVNNQLIVAKYFKDDRRFQKDTVTNFEDIMIIGSWSKTEYNGDSGLSGNFYTTAFDDRGVNDRSVKQTDIKGEDLGYGDPVFWTPALMFTTGTLTRSRYYQYTTNTSSTYSSGRSMAVCVPNLTRDCLLYAYAETSGGGGESEVVELRSVPDATSYSLWTYDPIYHRQGSIGFGEPFPSTGEYVYANYDPKKNRTENEYNFYTDSGNWYGVPEGSFRDVSSICSPYTSRSNPPYAVGGVRIGGKTPQINEYSKNTSTPAISKGRVCLSIKLAGSLAISSDRPDALYYEFMPANPDNPLYFVRDATWVTCGQSGYSNISELNDKRIRNYWGTTKLADHKSAHCFIGVINE